MIHDFDQSLETIIYQQGRINRSEVDVSFEIPTGDWSARLSRPTIDLWCFDLRENTRLRNADINGAMVRSERSAVMTQPPRRYDLCYLVTAWVRKIEDEHQLLWRALSALAQVPQLSPANAVGGVREQPFNIPIKVGGMPEFAVNITDLWSVVNNQMRLGFVLTATLALDIAREVEVPLVFEKRLEFGQTDSPLRKVITASDGAIIKKTNPKSKKPSG